jgi:hypothetical protein
MRRYSNGLFLDLVMINRVDLSFKLLGYEIACRNVLLKMDVRPSTTLVIESSLPIMLQGSMELALLKCLWEINQLIKYFVLGKSLMPYHRFKLQ